MDHHVEYEVMTSEIFSDLVIAVDLHIAAMNLEEEDEYMENLVCYFIQCIHLWILWHYSVIMFDSTTPHLESHCVFVS